VKFRQWISLTILCIIMVELFTSSVFAYEKSVSVFASTAQQTVDIEDTDALPPPERPAPDPNKPYVALTFDDGPHKTNTALVLDVLEQYDAKATFFVLGNRINSTTSPLLKRMLNLNCEIGNHSFDHPILSNLTPDLIRYQMRRTDEKVVLACGVKPKIMRPPYGSANKTVMANIGRPAIIWSLDTLDWETRNTQKVVAAVLNQVESGDIILMHDIHKTTANAVEPIIAALKEQGYQFLTVSEVLELRGESVEAGKKYY